MSDGCKIENGWIILLIDNPSDSHLRIMPLRHLYVLLRQRQTNGTKGDRSNTVGIKGVYNVDDTNINAS